MKNQKIPTWLGTVIIIIIAITVGMLVWKWEKCQNQITEQTQNTIAQNQQNNKKEMEQPIDISDWKTCKSEKYGYEFRYPNDWDIHIPVNHIITDCNNQTSLVLISNNTDEILQRVTFSLIKNAPALEDFISQNKSEIKIEKETIISGKKTIIYTKDTPRGEIKIIEIFGNGANYSLATEKLSSNSLFEAFVSSFKLLD